MKLVKDNVLFIAKHLDCIFAPEIMRWREDWHHEPALKTNLVRACKEHLPPEIWPKILTVYTRKIDDVEQKALGVCSRPSIVYNEEYGYQLIWSDYKRTFEMPKFTSAGYPIPEYLQQFTIEGDRIRQAFETNNGCTYAALAGFKLWEIDKE